MSAAEHKVPPCGLSWTAPRWSHPLAGNVDHECFRAAGHGSQQACICTCGTILAALGGTVSAAERPSDPEDWDEDDAFDEMRAIAEGDIGAQEFYDDEHAAAAAPKNEED